MDEDDAFNAALSEAVGRHLDHRGDFHEEINAEGRIVHSAPLKYEDPYVRASISTSAPLEHELGMNLPSSMPQQHQTSAEPLNVEPYHVRNRECSPEQYFSQSGPGRPAVGPDIRRVYQSSRSVSPPPDHALMQPRLVMRYEMHPGSRGAIYEPTYGLQRESDYYSYRKGISRDEHLRYRSRNDHTAQSYAYRDAPHDAANTFSVNRPARSYSPERQHRGASRAITPRLKSRQSRSRVNQCSENRQVPFEKLLQRHQRSQINSRNIASAIRNRLNEATTEKTPSEEPDSNEAKMDIGGKSIPVKDIRKVLDDAISQQRLRSPDQKKHVSRQPNQLLTEKQPTDINVQLEKAEINQIATSPPKSPEKVLVKEDIVRTENISADTILPDQQFKTTINTNESENVCSSEKQSKTTSDIQQDSFVQEENTLQIENNASVETVEHTEPVLSMKDSSPATEATDKLEQNEEDPDQPDESDDEELLNLRLVALSTAYQRNADAVIEDKQVIHQEIPDKKQSKSKKKKVKQKKKVKAADDKKSKSRSRSKEKAPPQSYSEAKSSQTKRMTLRSSVISISKNSSSRRSREKSPRAKDYHDPAILTLGAEIMRKKSQQEKSLLREIRNLDPDEGSKQFIKLMENKTQRNRKKLNRDLPSSDKQILGGDNYEEVEMELECDNETLEGNDIITNSNNNKEKPHEDETEQLAPPGTEPSLDQTPSQESIWELLDSPLKPLTEKQNLDEQPPEDRPLLPDIAAIRETIKTKLQTSDPDDSVPSPVESVDSGNEFQHAFDPPKLQFSMESNLVGEHSVCIDVDVDVASSESNDSKPVIPATSAHAAEKSEKPSEVKTELIETQPIPHTNKRRSTEDADELREKLLLEILTKRANTRLAESAKPLASVQSTPVPPEPIAAPPLPPVRPDALFPTPNHIPSFSLPPPVQPPPPLMSLRFPEPPVTLYPPPLPLIPTTSSSVMQDALHASVILPPNQPSTSVVAKKDFPPKPITKKMRKEMRRAAKRPKTVQAQMRHAAKRTNTLKRQIKNLLKKPDTRKRLRKLNLALQQSQLAERRANYTLKLRALQANPAVYGVQEHRERVAALMEEVLPSFSDGIPSNQNQTVQTKTAKKQTKSKTKATKQSIVKVEVKSSKVKLPKTEPHPSVPTTKAPTESKGHTTVTTSLPVKQESKPGFPQAADASTSKSTTHRKSVFSRLGQRISSNNPPTSQPDAVIDLTMMSDEDEAELPNAPAAKMEPLEDMLKRMRAKSAPVKEEVPVSSVQSKDVSTPVSTASPVATNIASNASIYSNGPEASKSEPPDQQMQTLALKTDVVTSTGDVADDKIEIAGSKPSIEGVDSVEGKLARLNDLLKSDRIAVLKLRAHKESRNKAIDEWKAEADALKKKLLALETNIEKELNVINQVDERLSKREGKMKQRQRLKQKFLKNLSPDDSKSAPVDTITTTNSEKKLQKSVPDTAQKENKPKTGGSSQSSSPAPSKVKRKRKSSSNLNVDKLAQQRKVVGALNSMEPARKNAKQSPVVPQPSKTALKQNTATGLRAKGSKSQTVRRSSVQIQKLKNRLEEKARLLMRAKTLRKQNERLGIQLDLKQKRLSPQKPGSRPSSPSKQVSHINTASAVLPKPFVQPVPTASTNAKLSSAQSKKVINQDGSKLGTKNVKEVIISLKPLDEQAAVKPIEHVTTVAIKPTDSVQGDTKATDKLVTDVPPLTPTLKKSRRTSKNSESDTGRRRSSSSDLSSFTNAVISDETKLAAASIIKSSFAPNHLAPYLIKEDSGSAVTRFFTVPDCLAKWKINIAEIARQTGMTSYAERDEFSNDGTKLSPYQSHLRAFRSYRFSSFLRTQENLPIASATFSNKIDPDRIVCRYGLHGQCLDDKCRAQHLDDMTLKPNELFLDLLSYCPSLLKNKDGKSVKSSDSYAEHLEAAETVVRNLCGATSMTLDEKCILLVSHINNALSSKMPHTTRYQRRRLKHRQKLTEDINEEEKEVEVDEEEQGVDLINDHDLDIFSLDIGPRYFATDGDELYSDLERLHQNLERNPDDEDLRIKLARSYLVETNTDNAASIGRRLDLALNILCLGIERAEQSEPLWCAYLPLLRHHHHGDLENKEEEEDIIDQVLLLLPYSKPVWREVMKWNWSHAKLDSLYYQLIHNLIHRYEATQTDEIMEVPELTESADYYSSWLLCAIVERCHLAQLCSDRDHALATLTNTLRELEELRQKLLSSLPDDTTSVESFLFPLTQQDHCRLHLTFIHVMEFGCLPDCFYDDSLSELDYGLRATEQTITLSFGGVNRLNNDPDQLREYIKEALLSCDDPTKSPAANTVNCLPLYRTLVDLEASLQRWDAVNITCERLIEMVQSDDAGSTSDLTHVTAVWCVWIDSILACGNAERITQTFDRAVTACPSSAKLAYTAALYQLHCDSPDTEAALLYMETCLSAFYELEGQNGLTAVQLFHKYKQLLKHDAPLIGGDQKSKGDVDAENFQHEKAYLWLIYCLLTELSGGNSIDVYEAAIYNVATTEGRKAIWLHYLLHLRSSATSLEGAAETALSSSSVLELMQQRMKWMRNMTTVVRRCLATIPCRRSVDTQLFTDYSFHNEVADVFLSCFSGRQRGVALSILADCMPTNIPLLLRTAGEHLRKGDHASVIASLWRVTSSSRSRTGCYDVRIWKIAIGAYLAERKYKKALQLCLRSLTIMPYCYRLWRDVSALLTLHGSKNDLQTIRVKCQKMLERDIRSFVDEELASKKTVFWRILML